MIDRGKGRKILKEGKTVRNINKNPQSYGIMNIQKKVPLSDKLSDQTYELKNPFELKEDDLSQRNC